MRVALLYDDDMIVRVVSMLRLRARDMHGWLWKGLVLLSVCLSQGTDSYVVVPEDDSKDIPLTSDELLPYHMRTVPMKEFKERMSSVRTYHDVIRIFYAEDLTNEYIDDMWTSDMYKPQTPVGRPRIGGLSDTMAFSIQRAGVEGMGHSLMLDAPESHKPLCEDCNPVSKVRRQHRKHRGSRSQGQNHRHGGRRKDRNGKKKNRDKKRNKPKGKGRKRKPGKGRKKKREMEKATSHMMEMEEKTKCKVPVPEVVEIRDISDSANKIYHPKCTIVHRCRKTSGCCNVTSECGPHKTETISRAFWAMDVILGQGADAQVSYDKRHIETFNFINHTECACIPLKKLPTCLDCPPPFFSRRENITNCTCDCFDKDQTCIKIKKGRKPLREEQLQCIKEGLCDRPKCQYGEFDEESLRGGFCPKQRREEDDTRSSGAHIDTDLPRDQRQSRRGRLRNG